LPSLLPEFAGKVNLIYIDPPFDTGADFSFTATVPDDPETSGDDSFSFVKEPSIIEQKAYRDTWGRGVESYLQWFYEAGVLLHELLHETGSIYVHLEPDIGNLVRVVLGEIFGPQSRRTEICWKRTSSHGNVSKTFGEIWESIFFYTKSEDWTWNQQYVPFDDAYIESHFTGRDPDGRRWTTSDLVNPGYRPNLSYGYKGYKPHKNGWKFTKERMAEVNIPRQSRGL
jgi:adenine-specific DNA-methyltransferase